MKTEIIYGYDHKEDVKLLFSEYTEMLVENDPEFKKYLDLQNYEDEIKHLEYKYGLPDGRLYLIYCDDNLAGCIALRKIDNKSCEMKRLYIKPHFRGMRLGSRLIEKIIGDAKETGYSYMLLDTLPFLKSALYLYKKFGFYEIDSYNNSPLDTTIYLKLDL